jgi:hypothetical protein
MTTVDAVMVRIEADASALRAELARAGEAAERDAGRIATSFEGAAGAIDRSLGGTFGRLRRQVAALDFDLRGLLGGLLGDLALGAAGAGIEGLLEGVFAGFAPRAAPAPAIAQRAGTGVTIQQTFVVNQGADAAAVAALHRTAARIKRETLAAVQDAQRRSAGGFV